MKIQTISGAKKIHQWLLIVLADALIYFMLAIFSMSFEDNYNSNFTDYFQAENLSFFDKMIPVLFYAWIFINIAFSIYIAYRLLKK